MSKFNLRLNAGDIFPHPQRSESSSRGLRDHEIQGMVNAIFHATGPIKHQRYLRDVVAMAITKYLDSKGLRIGKKQ